MKIFVFVPVTFWVFTFFLFAFLSILELGFGAPLGVYGKPAWGGAIRAALALGVTGFVLISVFTRIFSWVGEFWNEIERNWLAYLPADFAGLMECFRLVFRRGRGCHSTGSAQRIVCPQGKPGATHHGHTLVFRHDLGRCLLRAKRDLRSCSRDSEFRRNGSFPSGSSMMP